MNGEAVKSLTGMQTYPTYIDPFQKNVQKAAEAKGEVAGLQQEMETSRSAERAKAVAGESERFAQRMAGAPQRAELAAVSERMEAPFVPTKETAGDMAQLFALINIAGFALGAGGKQNAQAAMSGMNGMMEGYQKGRMDLYKKEKDLFDTNLKQLKMRYDTLDRQLKEAIETYKTDKEAGLQKAEMAYIQAGADFMKKHLDKVGLANNYEMFKQAYDSANKVWTERNREEERARAQAFREQQSRESSLLKRQQLDMQRQMLDFRMSEASKKGNMTGKTKADAKERQAYIADNILLADVNDMANDVKTNPKLVQMLKQYRVEAFLTEESKVLNQVLNEEIPPELRKFLTKVRDVRNNYYLNISGKAVTGGEALRNYGTVPQPGDSPEGILDKLDGMAGRIGRTIGVRQQMYGLPKLNIEPGTPTGLTPGENYGPPTSQGTAPAAPAAASSDRGSDEKGSYRWEYNADRTQRRKVYD